MSSGKLLVRYSKVEMCLPLLEFVALLMVWWIGCFSCAVCIRVIDYRSFLRSHRCTGRSEVSISIEDVVVVQNAPKMAFIAVRCAVSSLDRLAGGHSCFVGLCHTMAA